MDGPTMQLELHSVNKTLCNVCYILHMLNDKSLHNVWLNEHSSSDNKEFGHLSDIKIFYVSTILAPSLNSTF